MSNTLEDFLTPGQEKEIVEAIIQAEKQTSGEIRVHIEKTSNGDVNERAHNVFHLLKMDETELQNGVLIYVAVEDRSFVICGDKGIDKVVPKNFWDKTKEVIENQFKNGNFKDGIMEGVLMAGEQLKHFFPYTNNDRNELDNEISKG
jgi:uncharacterized membrane protein